MILNSTENLNAEFLENDLLSSKKMINIGKGKKIASSLPKTANDLISYQVNEKNMEFTFYKNIFPYKQVKKFSEQIKNK